MKQESGLIRPRKAFKQICYKHRFKIICKRKSNLSVCLALVKELWKFTSAGKHVLPVGVLVYLHSVWCWCYYYYSLQITNLKLPNRRNWLSPYMESALFFSLFRQIFKSKSVSIVDCIQGRILGSKSSRR